jgi:hypothetical protein
METTLTPYNLARLKIRDGDVLLFRRQRTLAGKAISVAGRSPYSHAAMAAWWHGRLMCLETLQRRGGRAVLLSTLVADAPARIDVFRVQLNRRRFNAQAAVESMIEITGRRYGWGALVRAGLVHLPLVRFFVRPETDDAANGHLPFCSQAVARACRAGGIDPVPNLADRSTEPGDLARSAALAYRFTLVPDEEPAEPGEEETTSCSSRKVPFFDKEETPCGECV